MSSAHANAAAGPVPFKDIVVVDEDDAVVVARQPAATEEYRDVVATLPFKLQSQQPLMRLRQYKGTWFPEEWIPGIVALHGRRFEPRAGDVVLASLPKCGATWLKALAFATAARGVYPPGDGDAHPLVQLSPHNCVPFVEAAYITGEEAKLKAAASPRLMSTHMSYSALPASITESADCKIIYICRQPKDMLISCWHFMNHYKPNTMSLSDVWKSIQNETYFGSPIWEHILGYWNTSKVKSEKVLFLKYEDVLLNPIMNVNKIAEFIGQPFSDSEKKTGIIESIVKLCSFENLKALDVNNTGFLRLEDSQVSNASFFRKGDIGDWTNYVTPEMAESLDKFLSDKFEGSGFTFTE